MEHAIHLQCKASMFFLLGVGLQVPDLLSNSSLSCLCKSSWVQCMAWWTPLDPMRPPWKKMVGDFPCRRFLQLMLARAVLASAWVDASSPPLTGLP